MTNLRNKHFNFFFIFRKEKLEELQFQKCFSKEINSLFEFETFRIIIIFTCLVNYADLTENKNA